MAYVPSPAFPVSVKGIVRIDGRFVLLENERGTWELPGGRLEIGEQPEQTLVREIEEELNIDVSVGRLVTSFVFEPVPDKPVLILIYETKAGDSATLSISDEHQALGLFGPDELAELPVPEGYRLALIRHNL